MDNPVDNVEKRDESRTLQIAYPAFTLYISLHSGCQRAVMVAAGKRPPRGVPAAAGQRRLIQPPQNRPRGLDAGGPGLGEAAGNARAVDPTGQGPVGTLEISFARRE